MVTGDLFAKRHEGRVVHVHEPGQNADHEHLADLLFQGKLLQGPLRPALAFMAERNMRGMEKIPGTERSAQ